MPEGVGYGSQNTASVGLNLNIIGRHCYAYSGSVSHDGDPTDLLNFISPASGYIVAWVGFDNPSNSNDNNQFTVLFNEQIVLSFMSTGRVDDNSPQSGRQLLIAPGTLVRCTVDRTSGTDAQTSDCTLTGILYGKIK